MRAVFMMMLVAASVGGCHGMHMEGGKQCMMPTPSEAKITKKVWM